MKKLIKTAVIVTACVGLCAGVWSRNGTGKEVSAAPVKSAASAEFPAVSTPRNALPIEGAPLEATVSAEKEKMGVTTTPAVSDTADASPGAEGIPQSAVPPKATQISAAATISAGSDPYHTDVYPENVYSEELLYNSDGELIGKIYTIPTAFGPDTIWIDGRAYYDIPGFGLVEWSGPNSVTEDYMMYENGNKVGIMGGEEEAVATASPSGKLEGQLEPTGEVINQAINAVPEKSSTQPNYKPAATPPDDPDARIIS